MSLHRQWIVGVLLLAACSSGPAFSTPTGPWTLKYTPPFPASMRFAVATTIGRTTDIEDGLTPNAMALGHEYFHVNHSSWFHYMTSYLTGGCYWKLQEDSANNAAATNAAQPWLIVIADSMRKLHPTIPPVTINHPVTLGSCH